MILKKILENCQLNLFNKNIHQNIYKTLFFIKIVRKIIDMNRKLITIIQKQEIYLTNNLKNIYLISILANLSYLIKIRINK